MGPVQTGLVQAHRGQMKQAEFQEAGTGGSPALNPEPIYCLLTTLLANVPVSRTNRRRLPLGTRRPWSTRGDLETGASRTPRQTLSATAGQQLTAGCSNTENILLGLRLGYRGASRPQARTAARPGQAPGRPHTRRPRRQEGRALQPVGSATLRAVAASALLQR